MHEGDRRAPRHDYTAVTPVQPTVEEPPPPPNRSRRWVILALVVAVLVPGLWFAGTWWTHPSQFGETDTVFRARQPADDRRPLHIAMTASSLEAGDREVRLDAAVPDVVMNSARATITFRVCTPRPGRAFIPARGPLGRSCSDVQPIDATWAHVAADDLGDFVVMTLSPRRPGVVRVRSVALTYGYGADRLWQHGTETTGTDTRLRVGQPGRR